VLSTAMAAAGAIANFHVSSRFMVIARRLTTGGGKRSVRMRVAPHRQAGMARAA
jgi:hypothetical protein